MKPEAAMRNFAALSQAEQAAAILKLAAEGMPEYSIAAATRLSVEMVRQILRRPGS